MVGWQILDRIGGTKYILLIKEYGGSPVLCSAAAADDLQVGARCDRQIKTQIKIIGHHLNTSGTFGLTV